MAIRDWQKPLKYDLCKEPFTGHVLEALLKERELDNTLFYAGTCSFETEEEYKALRWFDNNPSLTDEEKEMDPMTGLYKNERTYDEIKALYPTLPTFAEIKAEHVEYVQEYNDAAGKRLRVDFYPQREEQLDMIFHAIDQGLFGEAAKTSEFYTTIKNIKDTYQ